ncbi:hypothetical protein NP493_17g02039 [Ridgeia piscesae]|uniref:Glutaredoxin domain-containing protein n=1 Tax=Ridgeia piscesae TaxID=27915 RepID=A0AAD9UKN5_RIDPI|nr:hypothetical protein NP493_17g02039 [Ridgeia piscesae]
MKIVRSTAEKCERVRHILQTHMVRYDERDMFMSRENQRELMERFGVDVVDVPQVFADGKHLGDADVLEKLNETGELRNMFKHFKRVSRMTSCGQCGGYRYIPCTACHGSKKSLHRNDFTAEFCSLPAGGIRGCNPKGKRVWGKPRDGGEKGWHPGKNPP